MCSSAIKKVVNFTVDTKLPILTNVIVKNYPLIKNVFRQIRTPTKKIEQKGMTFDHDFGYFSSLLKKEGRRKGE